MYNSAQNSFSKGSGLVEFFSKQVKNGKWKVFLSANTKLSIIRMIEIYQTRGKIEVLFKESKQLPGLRNAS
jgi:IS4 transposase